MTTARAIVKRALQKAGVVTKNEDPSADEITDGLSDLNGMLGMWANDTLLLHARTLESFPVSAGTGEYTIGSGGDFDTSLPTRIPSAFLRIATIDYPMQEISDVKYDQRADKDAPGHSFEYLYERTYPLGKITLYPFPSQAGTLFLRTEKQFDTLALDDDLQFPAGWEYALIHNLAAIVAGEYGLSPSPVVVREAVKSKAALKATNARNRKMDTPFLTKNSYFNINSGTFN